jgi:hypothetical protein
VKRVLLATAALAAAVAVSIVVSLPPSRIVLPQSWHDGTVHGILHIHTNRSDGLSDLDEIAAAAARAGLHFIVFTDHGDATRTPDPPVYRSGVLCLDGVEISTSGGHYVAIDMGAAPYPLGGEPRDVVDDVHRLGGFGIAAHPDSPKKELAWGGWDAPFDGMEILNPDTGWRVHVSRRGRQSMLRLLEALLAYPFRSTETIGDLLTDSREARSNWTALTMTRHVVGIAGVDAHAKLALKSADPGDNRYALPIPGYESSFRALSVHVLPSEPLTGDAAGDAHRVFQSIRHGRLYTAVDAWASPPSFTFTASNDHGTVSEGEDLQPGHEVVLHVRHNGPDRFTTTVWRDTEVIAQDRPEHDLTLTVDPLGVYRVEVRDPNRIGAPAWITSNPIYVREIAPVVSPAPPPITKSLPLFDGRTTAGWTTEGDRSSLAAIDVLPVVSGPEIGLRYALSGGTAIGQFAGAAVDTIGGVAAYDRVAFSMRAEHPMRVSIQVRANLPDGSTERWQRSIFVDSSMHEYTVSFDDMTPIGKTQTSQPPRSEVHNILFVVDTTNTKTGQSGRLWMGKIRLER